MGPAGWPVSDGGGEDGVPLGFLLVSLGVLEGLLLLELPDEPFGFGFIVLILFGSSQMAIIRKKTHKNH